MSRVVVHTRDVVGARMAGPGLRAFHFAKELSARFNVTLVAELPDDFAERHGLDVAPRGTTLASEALDSASVVIGQPTRELLRIRRGRTRRVFDLFDPVVLELPEIYLDRVGLRGKAHQWIEWKRLNSALRSGDLLLCATRQQFAFYSGVHFGSGDRTNEWLSRWLTIPFGVEEREPAEDGEPMDLGSGPIAIWGGGTWPWLDPDSAVEAVKLARSRGSDLRILFMGGKRPNEEVERAAGPGWSTGDDPAVMRNADWVPYRERARWLRASRVAVMLHKQSLEAEFAIRTRLFDAIWCGVPIVVSRGGFAADLVEREGLGIVVAPCDIDEIALALERLTNDDDFHQTCVDNIARVRPLYEWKRVIKPLADRIGSLL